MTELQVGMGVLFTALWLVGNWVLFYGDDDSFLFAGPTAILALTVDTVVVVFGLWGIVYGIGIGIGKAILGVIHVIR